MLRRTFLSLVAALPLLPLGTPPAPTSAKRRKRKKKPSLIRVLEGYAVHPWKTPTVIVRDRMPARWSEIHAGMVDAINAAIPEGGPTVIYETAPYRTCEEIFAESDFEDGVIEVCDKKTLTHAATAYTGLDRRGRITHGVVSIPDPWYDEGGLFEAHRVSCHELMHAVLHVKDRAASDAPKDSCVLGDTKFPGAWDRAALELLYGVVARTQPPSSSV